MTLLTYRKFAPKFQGNQARRICLGQETAADYEAERNSLAAFWVHVLGADKPPQAHHLEWIELLQTGQDSEAIAQVAGAPLEIRGPRDSAKSTFAYVAVAWIIGWNPGARILYLSYSEAIALEQSRKIKRLIASPRYQEVFPWVRVGRRNNEGEWEIDKPFALSYANKPERVKIGKNSDVDSTYTLYATGVTGSVMGKRADFCFCDDLIKSAEAIASAEVRAKMLDNLNGVVEPCLVQGARWVDVGMLARRDDVHLKFFTEANGFAVHTTSAIAVGPDGTERSYWPERHPLERLQQRRMRSPKIFGLQFQNEIPQDEDNAIILAKDIRWGSPPVKLDELWLAIDLAATEKEESDYTAFVMFGKVKHPLHYWVLSCELFKASGNLEKLRRITELRRELKRPFRIVFEKGAYQNSFEGDLLDYRQQSDRELVTCPAMGIPSTKDLRQRLINVSGAVENGFVSFAEGGNGVQNLVWQITNAHTDDLDHDDAASAFALGLGALLGRGTGNVWTA